MRVLIDTNVLISAALSAGGTPYQAYVKAALYPNHGLICEQNVDEMKRIFNKKFPNRLAALDSFWMYGPRSIVREKTELMCPTGSNSSGKAPGLNSITEPTSPGKDHKSLLRQALHPPCPLRPPQGGCW